MSRLPMARSRQISCLRAFLMHVLLTHNRDLLKHFYSPKAVDLLREMMQTFYFFEDLVRNVEIGLAKADMEIARLYSSLVQDEKLGTRTYSMLLEEFERSLRAVLTVTGQSRLLETNPVLDRSIRLRNPYVDPLSLIQVELLRRKRAGEDSHQLNYALAATINGIAAGLRNTG